MIRSLLRCSWAGKRGDQGPFASPACWLIAALLILGVLCPAVHPDDWPQWLGPRRDGVWRETGLLETFPKGGPKVLWRVPIGGGIQDEIEI